MSNKRQSEKRPLYFRAISVIEALPRIPLNAGADVKSVHCTGFVDGIGFIPVEYFPDTMKFYTKYGGTKRECKVMYWMVPMDEDMLVSMLMADINKRAAQQRAFEEAQKELDDKAQKSVEPKAEQTDGKEG